MIAKYVDALEARLGVRLFHRTTRKLTLTEEGAAFREHRDGFARRLGGRRSAPSARTAAGRMGRCGLTLPCLTACAAWRRSSRTSSTAT
jgi:DNA-binding transcriptional LysR family regulator